MERPAAAEDQVGVFRVGGRVVTHDGFFAKIVGLADGGAVSCATRAPGAPDSLLLALDVAGVGLREAVPASSVTPSSLRTVRASGSPHKRDWVALRFKGLKSVAPRPHSDSFLCARCNGAVATIDGVHKENLAPAGLSPRRLVSPRQDRPSSSAASPRRLTSPRQQDQGREELSLFGAALKKSSHLERELKTMQEAHASEMQLLIEKHEQDARKRDQSISSRDTQIEQLKAEALEHKATLADEQRRRDAQWHELQNMRDQTEDATKTMAVLTKNLAQAVARGEELEKQVEAAKALVREALAHGDAEREAVDKLSADIKSKEVKEEEHLKEIKTLKDELQTVREGLEESERKRQTDQKMHRTVMQRQTAEILDLKTKVDANNGKNAAACVDVDFQASIVRFQALLDDAVKTGQLSSDDLFVRTRLLGLRHKMDQLLESEHSPDEEVPFELTMCSQYL